MALKKQCRCGTRIEVNQRCCDNCTDFYNTQRKASYKLYDEKKRDKQAHAFYLTTEWQTLRDIVLNKYAGIDLFLYYTTGTIQKANTVHHIVEISEDSSRKLDVTNLFPLTQRTHEKIHRLYQNNRMATQELLFSFIRRWEEEVKG